MKPNDVREVERIVSQKSMVEMAIALLREADTMSCGKNIHDAMYLLDKECQTLDGRLQDLMD